VKILMTKTFVDSSPASNLNFEIYLLRRRKQLLHPQLCIIFARSQDQAREGIEMGSLPRRGALLLT
jgi:hypothetical protein